MDISSSKATHQIAESGFSLPFYLQIKMMGLDREVGIAGSADVDLRLLRHLHVSGFVAGVREGAVMRPDGQWTPWSCPRYLIPEFVRAERRAGAGHAARRVLSFPSPSVILEVGLGEESRYRLAFEARTWLEAFVPSQAQEEGLLDLSSIVRPVQVVVTIIIYSDTPKVVVQKWERMSPQNQNQNQSQSQRVTRSSSRAVVSKTDEVVITRSSSDTRYCLYLVSNSSVIFRNTCYYFLQSRWRMPGGGSRTSNTIYWTSSPVKKTCGVKSSVIIGQHKPADHKHC
ncbi:hypothetical protein M432DRAFT_114805 [Thermoascus aurantiacus ATCC 26904]